MKKQTETFVERQPIQRITPSLSYGLNAQQVQERVDKGYTNLPPEDPSNTVGQIIRNNLCSYFNFLFFFLAVCIILVGSYTNLMFMPIVIINIVIGIIQEVRAKRVIDKLTVLSQPHTRVLREGTVQQISTSDLVLDDLVLLGAGNQIPADAVILEGQVHVNESLITGESDEIIKNPGDSLYSGSFIVSGSCQAVLEKVGVDSFAARLTHEAKKKQKRVRSEMMNSLNRLIAVIGVLIIPLGGIMFYKSWKILGIGFQDSVVTTVAALVGMVPEGLYLLTSVALAVSVIRLGQKKVLVHEMGCIETLARVDVLCVDKTGTVTEPDMKVTDLEILNGQDEFNIRRLLGTITAALPADNITMQALKQEYTIPSPRIPVSIAPFSSATKYSGVSFGPNETYLIGAPEFLLKNLPGDLSGRIERYANEGKRVLLLASYPGDLPQGPLSMDAVPIAFVAIMNPIRKEAPETFQYFAKQGVAIKVISGDHALTVSRIAENAGIENASQYIDASTLTDDASLEAAAEKYTVFGRVTPDQKRVLIRALKAKGHKVAMTGDGVNDVLALKDADCSIAMASGSDAACQVAQLVLLDSNFSAMPAVVAEGRRVVNNIERSASLFLVKNIFSFLIALVAVFFPLTYPLTPSQLSIISTLTIGIPSFFLALEPNTNLVRGHFMRNVLFRAMPAGLTDFIIVLGVLVWADAFGIDGSEASTASVILMGFIGFLMLYRVCSPLNLKRRILLVGLAMIFILIQFLFRPFFELVILSYNCLLIFIVFFLLSMPAIRNITLILDYLSIYFHKYIVPFGTRIVRKWRE